MSGSFWGNIGEFIGVNNNFSTAGKERVAAERAMAFTAAENQKARDYNTTMSNTAHQREISDLKAAGLNPVLSVSHQGASTPASPSGQGVKANQGVSNSTGFAKGLSQVVMTAAKLALSVAGGPLGKVAAGAMTAASSNDFKRLN